jgi:hypothetical protein
MKRYLLLITTQGLDAVLTLADDAEEAKQRVSSITNNRARLMYLFEKGEDPYRGTKERSYSSGTEEVWSHDFEKFKKSKREDAAREVGSSPIEMYYGFNMRKSTHGDFLEVSLNVEPEEMQALRQGDPYKSAHKILNILEKDPRHSAILSSRGGMGKNIKIWKGVMKAHL